MTHVFGGDAKVTRFFYLGVLTTAQRDTAATAESLGASDSVLIYNSTTSQLEQWDGSAWSAFSAAGDAGDITVTAVGNLASTDVQAALEELQGDIDNLTSLGSKDYVAGSGAPNDGTDGVDGNYYLNVANGDVYGPKAAGAWPGSPIDNVYDQLGLATVVPIETDDDTGAVGVATTAAREDHKHPRDEEVNDLRTSIGTATDATDLGTFTGDTIADSRDVKTALQDLETALEVEQTGSPQIFNATTDWGSASGGYYSYSIVKGTHGRGDNPIYQVQSGTGPYEDITPHSASVTAAGTIVIQVTEAPNGRFAGRVLVK